jgi:ferredoxin
VNPPKGKEHVMKVSIDLNKCSGHARCYAVDAELFQLDQSGYALHAEIEIPPGEEEKARLAVVSCPERAISLQ